MAPHEMTISPFRNPIVHTSISNLHDKLKHQETMFFPPFPPHFPHVSMVFSVTSPVFPWFSVPKNHFSRFSTVFPRLSRSKSTGSPVFQVFTELAKNGALGLLLGAWLAQVLGLALLRWDREPRRSWWIYCEYSDYLVVHPNSWWMTNPQ